VQAEHENNVMMLWLHAKQTYAITTLPLLNND